MHCAKAMHLERRSFLSQQISNYSNLERSFKIINITEGK